MVCQVFRRKLFHRKLVRKWRVSSVYFASRNVCSSTRKQTLGIIHQGGEKSRSPNASSYQRLGCCEDLIERDMEFARKNALGLATRTFKKSQELTPRHVTKFSHTEQNNSRESCRISVRLPP